jgi:hypothetical protein
VVDSSAVSRRKGRDQFAAHRLPDATRGAQLALKSSKTGEPLLTLDGGSAVFSFGEIWRMRLEELRLDRPDLVISPDLGDALGVQPAKSEGKSSNPLGWGIGRFVVNGGHLRITRFGGQSPTMNLDFSADFHNFGVGGEAGAAEHSARLEKITAVDSRDRSLLDISDADVRFTTDELFARDHLRAVRIGNGTLAVEQALSSF